MEKKIYNQLYDACEELLKNGNDEQAIDLFGKYLIEIDSNNKSKMKLSTLDESGNTVGRSHISKDINYIMKCLEELDSQSRILDKQKEDLYNQSKLLKNKEELYLNYAKETIDHIKSINNEKIKKNNKILKQKNPNIELINSIAKKNYEKDENDQRKTIKETSSSLSKNSVKIEKDSNAIEKDYSAKTKKKVDDIISEFNKEQQKSLRGDELVERFKKRAGKDIGNIAGHGENTLGTTRGKLKKLVEVANEKEYEVEFRKNGTDKIDIILIPKQEYNPDNINWDSDHIQFSVQVGSNGRINNKINKPIMANEKYVQNGKSIVSPMIETAETNQLDPIIGYISGKKFKHDNRNNEEISKLLNGLAKEKVNQLVPIDSNGYTAGEIIKENIDNEIQYSGKLGENELVKSTEIVAREYISSILRNSNFQEAVRSFYELRKKGSSKYLDFEDPSKEIIKAIIDTINISAQGIDKNSLNAMEDSSLLKFLLTTPEMKYVREASERIFDNVGLDYTALTEGGYGMGRIGTTSSMDYTPFGKLIDNSQRSLSQAYRDLPLTKKAIEARRKGGAKSSLFATELGLSSGIDYTDPEHQTMVMASIAGDLYDELQREYYKQKGYSNEEIEKLLYSLTDKVLVGNEFSEMNESSQLTARKGLRKEEISKYVLDQIGISQEDLNYDNYSVGQSIDLKDKTIKLGKSMAKKFGLNENDEIVQIEKDIEGWKLSINQIKKVQNGTKIATRTGLRATVEKDDDKFQWMIDKLGLKGKNVTALTENVEVETRKYGPDFLGQLDYIITSAVEATGDLQGVYAQIEKEFPVIAKMIRVSNDSDNGFNGFVDKLKKDWEGQIYSIDDSGKVDYLFSDAEETAKEFGNLSGLAKLLGVEQSNNAKLLRSGIGLHDVRDYEDVVGGGDQEGRVRNDIKIKRAHKRNLAFVGNYVKGQENISDEVKRGIDSITAQLVEADERITKSTQDAINIRQDLKNTFDSIDNGYQSDAQDIQLVTRESLNGEEPKEYQIVIDDESLITNLSEATDDTNRMTEDTYNNTVMEVARKRLMELQGKYGINENSRIVIDASGIFDGGKVIALSSQEGSRGAEGKIMPSNVDKMMSLIVDTIRSGNKEEWDELIPRIKKQIYKQVNNKNGSIYDAARHNYIEHSGFAILEGISKDAKLTAEEANTIYMDRERFVGMRKTEENASRENLKKNVDSLLQEYKAKTSKKNWKKFENKKAFKEFELAGGLENADEETLRNLENLLANRIADDIEKGNDNYTLRFGRYPYTQGKEGNLHRVGIRSGLGNTILMSQGLLHAYRGDTDGDKGRAALSVYQKYGEDELKAEQAMLEYYDKYAENMNKIVSIKEEKEPDDWSEIAETLKDQSVNKMGSERAKMAFGEVGKFSNTATNARESMAHLGFGVDTINDKEQAFQADIIRAYLEALEQDAISAKKIIKRIAAQKKKSEGLSNQESIDSAYLEVESIMSNFKSGNYEEAIRLSNEFGIIDDLKGTKQFDSVRASWMAANPEFFKQLASNNGFEGFADLSKSGAGAGISIDYIVKSFRSLEGFLKNGQTMRDVFGYTSAIDPVHTVANEERNDRVSISNTDNKSKINETISNLNGGILNTESALINVNKEAIININGQSTINGSISSGQSDYKNRFSAKTFGSFIGEDGKLLSATALKGIVFNKDTAHTYTFDENGKRVKSDQYAYFSSMSQLFNVSGFNEPMDPYNYGIKANAAEGTLVHDLLESIFSDVSEEEKAAMREKAQIQYHKSYTEGGAGDRTDEKFASEESYSRANLLADVAKTLMPSGKNLVEYDSGFSIGDNKFGGKGDILNISKQDGAYFVQAGDWKNSNSGGEDDPMTRAQRMIQLSANLLGVKKELESLIPEIKEFEEKDLIDQSEKYGIDFKYDSNKSIEENRENLIKEMNLLIDAFSNAKIRNFRVFKNKDTNENVVETIEGNAIGESSLIEIIAQLLSGMGFSSTRVLNETGVHTSKYTERGENGELKDIERPQFIDKKINDQNKEKTPAEGIDQKDYNKYIGYLKDRLAIDEEIAKEELLIQTLSGEDKEKEEELLKTLNERKDVLDEILSNTDRSKMSSDQLSKILLLEARSSNKVYKTSPKENYSGIANRFDRRIANFFDYKLVDTFFNKIRQGFQNLIKQTETLDKAIVNLQIATGYTYKQTQGLMVQYSNLANDLGRTTSDVASAANDWLRAGYDGSEAIELVKSSMYLSTLGMMSAENATSSLISVLKGWKLSSEEVIGVVDKLVSVDMSAAVKNSRNIWQHMVYKI